MTLIMVLFYVGPGPGNVPLAHWIDCDTLNEMGTWISFSSYSCGYVKKWLLWEEPTEGAALSLLLWVENGYIWYHTEHLCFKMVHLLDNNISLLWKGQCGAPTTVCNTFKENKSGADWLILKSNHFYNCFYRVLQ